MQGSRLRGKRCLVLVMAEKFLRMERGKWEFEAQMDLYTHILSYIVVGLPSNPSV